MTDYQDSLSGKSLAKPNFCLKNNFRNKTNIKFFIKCKYLKNLQNAKMGIRNEELSIGNSLLWIGNWNKI